MASRNPAKTPFGINLIGYVSGNLGLGVATRNTIRMLEKLRVPMALTDVDPGGNRMGHDRTYVALPADATDRTPWQVNIFHMNPPGLADQLWLNKSWSRDDRISASVLFWELPVVPATWLPVLDAMDIVLAPTRFVEDAVRTSLPHANCVYYRQTAYVPDGIEPDRAKWGIPHDAITFVSSFDISSDIERKNPEATLAAFREAFPADENVCLVLKVNSSAEARALFADRLGSLLAAAAADPRIVLIDRVLNYRDVLSLYASSDALISLHRSEGLGLSLMEAMYLRRPVITTGWSGNMDFTTPENSCLVGYDLVPVNSSHPSYSADLIGPDVVWADPHVPEAAAHMRRLAADPQLLRTLGERAHADMVAIREAYESGELVESLMTAVAPGSPVWQVHPAKRRALKRIARGSLYRNVRLLGGRVLRRLGLR